MWLIFLSLAVAAIIGALTIHPDHAGSKSEYALWLIAATCLAIAAYVGVRDRFARGRKKRTRICLAVYVQYGQEIIGQCHFTERRRFPAPEDWATAWGQAIHAYIESELGTDYAARLENNAGLPMGFTVLSLPYSRIEGYVKSRIARITEFIQELAEPK